MTGQCPAGHRGSAGFPTLESVGPGILNPVGRGATPRAGCRARRMPGKASFASQGRILWHPERKVV